ncbi:hypothetical protein DEU56DRAFT_945845 [Suillus clintonianus]|uniref:uncharacterized protein n=1 Tax=Suillus clintonianus TaxID=1904413 RepID=UPI001B8745B3|nr:uncharacterized protein DEU56DRAFT_945845 [Suillus clintonianus]KAG2138018.1 hypothetical protein DEU56DRAFT_945845 [Suillus clintonianus]
MAIVYDNPKKRFDPGVSPQQKAAVAGRQHDRLKRITRQYGSAQGEKELSIDANVSFDYNDHRKDTLLGAATLEQQKLLEDATQERLELPVLKDGKGTGLIRLNVNSFPFLKPELVDGKDILPQTAFFYLNSLFCPKTLQLARLHPLAVSLIHNITLSRDQRRSCWQRRSLFRIQDISGNPALELTCLAGWTFRQMLAFHTLSGCRMRAGDLIGMGALSGEDPTSLCSLIEQRKHFPNRMFLQDRDKHRNVTPGSPFPLIFPGMAPYKPACTVDPRVRFCSSYPRDFYSRPAFSPTSSTRSTPVSSPRPLPNSADNTLPTSKAGMSKEEKAAEMARRKEERQLRIEKLREQKKNTAAAGKA